MQGVGHELRFLADFFGVALVVEFEEAVEDSPASESSDIAGFSPVGLSVKADRSGMSSPFPSVSLTCVLFLSKRSQ